LGVDREGREKWGPTLREEREASITIEKARIKNFLMREEEAMRI